MYQSVLQSLLLFSCAGEYFLNLLDIIDKYWKYNQSGKAKQWHLGFCVGKMAVFCTFFASLLMTVLLHWLFFTEEVMTILEKWKIPGKIMPYSCRVQKL
jgi:hypothetical protein